MSKKVKKYLVIDLIVMGIVTVLGLWISGLCGGMSNEWVGIALKILVNGIWIIFDLIFVFFFFLYWWSDVKWTQIKAWARKRFNK